jgi:GAF domain-containing protein
MTDPRATTDFEALFAHCAAITNSLELTDLIKTTLAAAAELLPSDQVVLTIVEDGLIKVLAADPPVSLEIMENGLAIGRGLVGRAVAERTPIYSPDLSVDDRVQQTRKRWDSTDRSVVAVPLALGDQVIGALHAISQRVDAFSEQDRARLIALAPAVAIAMRNSLVLNNERESWAHSRKLDQQKSAFMRLAAQGLRQPLEEVAELVDRIRTRPEDLEETSHKLLDRTQRLAHQVEEVLELSLKDSADIVLTD